MDSGRVRFANRFTLAFPADYRHWLANDKKGAARLDATQAFK